MCWCWARTVYVPYVRASDAPNQQEAVSRMQKAVAKTDIFELPPFAVKASVQIENQGKLVDGAEQLLWNGPDQWREAVSFPGYGEIQLGGKGTVWLQRRTDFIPLRIYNLHEVLGFGTGVAGSGALHSGSLVQLSLTSKERVKHTHEPKDHGETVTCTQIEDEDKFSAENLPECQHSGTLIRGSTYLDRDHQPVGTKVFARFMSVLDRARL